MSEALSIYREGRKETQEQKKKKKVEEEEEENHKKLAKKTQTQTKPNRKQLGGGLVLIEDVYNIYGL